MKSRVRHVSYILDFLDLAFEANAISKVIKSEFDALLEKNSLSSKTDWEIQLRATYTNGRQLLISKNKFGSYPSDRIKEITIPIPIPLTNMVPWGVQREQHMYSIDHYDEILHNFWTLDVDYSKFDNCNDYILNCLRRVLDLIFLKEYTVNGVKLNRNQRSFRR